jgi:hypothetical protein
MQDVWLDYANRILDSRRYDGSGPEEKRRQEKRERERGREGGR